MPFPLSCTFNCKTHKAYNRVRENNFSLERLQGFNLYGKTATHLIPSFSLAPVTLKTFCPEPALATEKRIIRYRAIVPAGQKSFISTNASVW